MSRDRPLGSIIGRDIPRERRCDLKVLAHTAAIIGLYLACSFALFWGLQVNPVVGHDGAEDNTLGPDDCRAHSPWPGRKTQTLSC